MAVLVTLMDGHIESADMKKGFRWREEGWRADTRD